MARSVQLALAGEFVPDAVNVQVGGVVGEEVRPWLPLVQKLGTMLYAVAGRVPSSVTVDVAGELAAEDVTVLQLAALRGLFTHVVEDQVTFVNAPALAAERGVDVELTTAPESENHRSVVQLRAAMPDGESITVSGTLTGRAQVQKLVEVNGRHFDLRAEGDVRAAGVRRPARRDGPGRLAARRGRGEHRGRADQPDHRRHGRDHAAARGPAGRPGRAGADRRLDRARPPG